MASQYFLVMYVSRKTQVINDNGESIPYWEPNILNLLLVCQVRVKNHNEISVWMKKTGKIRLKMKHGSAK
jgi:hypothetical protein